MKKFDCQDELFARVVITLQCQVDPAQIVDGHSLPKRLVETAIGPKGQSEILERFVILAGIVVRSTQVVQDGGLALQVLQSGKEIQRLKKIFNGLDRVAQLFVVRAQVVQRDPLLERITGSLRQLQLLVQLLKIWLGFRHVKHPPKAGNKGWTIVLMLSFFLSLSRMRRRDDRESCLSF